jgi:hypothetical protein
MAASDSHNDYLKHEQVARLVVIPPTVIPLWESIGRAHPRRSAYKPIALAFVSIGFYALTS